MVRVKERVRDEIQHDACKVEKRKKKKEKKMLSAGQGVVTTGLPLRLARLIIIFCARTTWQGQTGVRFRIRVRVKG